MFSNYGFFDYKYNIPGYSGQDYDGYGRMIYLLISLFALFLLLILLRKTKREFVIKYLKVMGIFMCALYLTKTTWESYFDITTGQGFNTGLLPFDLCSLVMPCMLIAGFAKGKAKESALAWLATGGVVGGISNLLFLPALKYYPFFTFGAFYSMFWHFIMVFTGIWLYQSGLVRPNFKTVLSAFMIQLFFSMIVIPYDYIRNEDFMFFLRMGGLPLVEDLGIKLYDHGFAFVNTILVLHLFFITFSIIAIFARGMQSLANQFRQKKLNSAQI